MTRGQLIGAIIVGLAALLLLGLFAGPKQAKAHQSPKGWQYPSDCCSPDGKECHRVESHEIAVTAAGYVYRGKLFRFGDKGIKLSGDGDWHACERVVIVNGVEHRWKYCVIVPEGGMG